MLQRQRLCLSVLHARSTLDRRDHLEQRGPQENAGLDKHCPDIVKMNHTNTEALKRNISVGETELLRVSCEYFDVMIGFADIYRWAIAMIPYAQNFASSFLFGELSKDSLLGGSVYLFSMDHSACCPDSGLEHISYIKVPPGERHVIKLIFLFTKTDLSSNLQFYLSIKVNLKKITHSKKQKDNLLLCECDFFPRLDIRNVEEKLESALFLKERVSYGELGGEAVHRYSATLGILMEFRFSLSNHEVKSIRQAGRKDEEKDKKGSGSEEKIEGKAGKEKSNIKENKGRTLTPRRPRKAGPNLYLLLRGQGSQ
ncbi:hypothetical protein MG293_020190 [Ovis ammon polii]|uniref:Uncharacterized protein n=1 Tax=Ovis ammon polii TaxID=230172 RepID=A0AAD4Y0F4_OVIAM|nr:hypothetical protein MG293_020190 [Ovis ammon polii]